MSFGSAWGKLISKQEKVIVDADTQNQESFMLFAIPVDTGTYNGFSYDALAVSYSSDALNAALGVSAFRGQATCYITDLSGNIIFSDSPTKPIGKNLLNYLADCGIFPCYLSEGAGRLGGQHFWPVQLSFKWRKILSGISAHRFLRLAPCLHDSGGYHRQ